MKALKMVGSCILLLAFAGLVACSESEDVVVGKPDPVHFESGDECHVCGMVITRFPGPKGEAITEREQHVRKFCSTREMLGWVLQPENVNRDHTLYVHDMAQTEWAHPDDTVLIDARQAWYVVGSDRDGAMGPTLASFARKGDAESFASEHGGEMLPFADLTMEHLASGHDMSHSM